MKEFPLFVAVLLCSAFTGMNDRVWASPASLGEFDQESEFYFRKSKMMESDGRQVKAWLSPDESKVVINDRGEKFGDIFVSNPDGSEKVQLTKNRIFDNQPSWSPDGNKIMFCSNRSGEFQVYEMDADGGNLQQLTDESHGVRKPRYSPQGWKTWLVSHPQEGKVVPGDLVFMKGDEKVVVREKARYVSDYSWSPDGERLCFTDVNKLMFYEVEDNSTTTIDLKGKDQRLYSHTARQITWNSEFDAVACRIDFLGGRMGSTSVFGDNEVFVISLDGEKFEVLSPDDVANSEEEWIREEFTKPRH